MKKFTITTILFFMAMATINAQNAELSTLRIGAFTYQMTLEEAVNITEKPLVSTTEDYGQYKTATYKGDKIKLQFSGYDENTIPSDIKLYQISTKSPKFKTKRGLGVGSTKAQLFEAYKDYPNFSVGQRWNVKTEKLSITESYFMLEDITVGTKLNFIMNNNVVVELEIYMDEGC